MREAACVVVGTRATSMKMHHVSTDIRASRQTVWETMVGRDTFKLRAAESAGDDRPMRGRRPQHPSKEMPGCT
jgi:hypothetical protein